MTKQTAPVESADFKEAVELLSIYSQVENELATLETALNKLFLSEVEEIKPQYALIQATLQEASDKLEVITLRHPEWFAAGKKSVKTPFGELKFHKSTAHEAANEELTVVLIETELSEIAAKLEHCKDDAQIKLLAERQSFLNSLLRRETHVDLDNASKCDEATLKKFRITRTEKQNFSIKAAKVNLGKAVKAASKPELAVAA